MSFVPNTAEIRRHMLESTDVSSFDELIACIPDEVLLTSALDLPEGISELQVSRLLSQLAERNRDLDHTISFLGGGVYDHALPRAVHHMIRRSEFYTAYTPYQAEVSQGTLQAIYEYQSVMCQLTDMDVSNASLYDGASALAEAALLAHYATRRNEMVVSHTLNPFYASVLETYGRNLGFVIRKIDYGDGVTDIEKLQKALSDETACCLIQHPNFFGYLEPMDEIERHVHRVGALFVSAVDPISLGLLKPPGTYGADICVGEGQALGNPLSFGGPSFGFLTTTKNLIRRIPGRIVGTTADGKGQRGFVMTLQTREQHIRREKATSNICTNEALNALAGVVYLSLLGKEGLRKVAELSLQKSHYTLEKLEELGGFGRRFTSPFFKEFVVKTPKPPGEIVNTLAEQGIFAGIDLDRFKIGLDDCLSIAVTEKRTVEDIDTLLSRLAQFRGKISSA
ncbi:MAG: aminomethyl-transferring glycine dehydrogenase subunit GcvPA [Gemmatimonadota bacterium]|nr:MAG: aminomethyl-transferring glycine dehydrogenase subunit GcvPA [Gemmatimonadota bacterium]